MFVNALQLACNYLLLLVHGGSGYFQVNELYTRKLKALPSAYTQHKLSYISFIMSKIIMFQSNIFSSGALISIF